MAIWRRGPLNLSRSARRDRGKARTHRKAQRFTRSQDEVAAAPLNGCNLACEIVGPGSARGRPQACTGRSRQVTLSSGEVARAAPAERCPCLGVREPISDTPAAASIEFTTPDVRAHEQFDASRGWHSQTFDGSPGAPAKHGFLAKSDAVTMDGLALARVSMPATRSSGPGLHPAQSGRSLGHHDGASRPDKSDDRRGGARSAAKDAVHPVTGRRNGQRAQAGRTASALPGA